MHLRMTDKFDGTKNRVVELMSRDSVWGSRGVMNLVGKVLGGTFGIDNEVEDENPKAVNIANSIDSCDTRKDIIQGRAVESGKFIHEAVIDEDLEDGDSVHPFEGSSQNGNRDLAIDVKEPDNKSAANGGIATSEGVTGIKTASEDLPDSRLYSEGGTCIQSVNEGVADVTSNKLVSERVLDSRLADEVVPLPCYKTETEGVPASEVKDDERLDNIFHRNMVAGGESGSDGLLDGESGNDGLLDGESGNDGLLDGESGNDGLLDGESGNDGLSICNLGDNGMLGYSLMVDGVNDIVAPDGFSEEFMIEDEAEYKISDVLGGESGNDSLPGGKSWIVEVNDVYDTVARNSVCEELMTKNDVGYNVLNAVGGESAGEGLVDGKSGDGGVPLGKSGENGRPVHNLECDEVNNANDVDVPDEVGEGSVTENEVEYKVSDIVWGKVRSHPWWPGQIFEPSAASDKAMRHFKKDSYLIAYFGDQTFAWNDATKIRPFQMYFSEMEKQSTSEKFCHSVVCALDEVSKRVELGLSCLCLPQEVYSKIKYQVVNNAGIQKTPRIRDCGDSLSSVTSFFPGDLLHFLHSSAEAPRLETNRLHLGITKAQLLAFNRWKGYYQLPILEQFDTLWDDTEIDVEEGGMPSRDTVKGVLSGKKREFCYSEQSNYNTKRHKSMPFPIPSNHIFSRSLSNLRVGERICRVFEYSDNVASPDMQSSDGKIIRSRSEQSAVEQIVRNKFHDYEILSKLSMAAANPMQGHQILGSTIGLLHHIRKSLFLKKPSMENRKKHSEKFEEEELLNVEGKDSLLLEGTEDSYWTDRILEGHSQEQVLFQSETPTKRDTDTVEFGPDIGINANLTDENLRDQVNTDSETEDLTNRMNEGIMDHFLTALIIKFTNLESIPSVAKLNEIFGLYESLNGSLTKILRKSKCAKVFFNRRADAETAFSSSGQYSIFGSAIVSYRLHYTAIKARTTAKRKRKAGLVHDM